jgi:hypothetical protein
MTVLNILAFLVMSNFLPTDKNKGEHDTLKLADAVNTNYWQYDSSIIPCFDLYENVWDQLNVNVPGFDPSKMDEGIWLCLRDNNDCQYFHPNVGQINSNFGWRWSKMHNGVDIELDTGDPVYSAFDGVVRISKENPGGYGLYVVVRHYNGLETLYGHLSEKLVEVNQPVRAGDIIGLGGSTGRSTGPHLHFEIRFKGNPIDPQKFISFEEGALKMDSVLLDKSFFQFPTSTRKTTSHSKYHKVKSGETLWGIANKNHLTVKQLCKLNGIKENAVLSVGKTLKVK